MLVILVLKLVKLAKGVRSLLDTLFEALPQVCSIICYFERGVLLGGVLSTKNRLKPMSTISFQLNSSSHPSCILILPLLQNQTQRLDNDVVHLSYLKSLPLCLES